MDSIEQIRKAERDKIKDMMRREQYRGDRDYTTGCIKAYERVMWYCQFEDAEADG